MTHPPKQQDEAARGARPGAAQPREANQPYAAEVEDYAGEKIEAPQADPKPAPARRRETVRR